MKRREEGVMSKTVIKLMFLKKCTCVSLTISVFVVCRHFGAKTKIMSEMQ